MTSIIQNIVRQFRFQGEFIFIERFGNGHINGTFAVYFKTRTNHPIRYILQVINTNVFKHPDQVMSNVNEVTRFLKAKITEAGGDPMRETLSPILTQDGALYYEDKTGSFWRAYAFIDDATCYETITSPELFFKVGKAFGKFQNMLADFPVDKLYDTIPRFHDTVKRYEDLEAAIAADPKKRAASIKKEIEFVRARKADCSVVLDLIASGDIPRRVTHNDTKLNNVMIDNKTGEGICVIDLDTVMQGSVLYDFGDSIRFGASSAAEDEPDPSKVYMDISLFDGYTKGFLKEVRHSLTKGEVDNLAFSAKLLTLECGIRFLTDYLNGDVYFKTTRPRQNLDRARTQLKLVEDMENKMDKMNEIVHRYAGM